MLNTAVFVDYEYWAISQEQEFKSMPNISLWVNDLKTRGIINELTFFGDFSGNLFGEIKQIRTCTNRIIDTRQEASHHKKDFTDFIMLDHIYQKVMSAPDIEQIILFTGDAHFASVAAYLRTAKQKTVGLYGITNTISRQLTNIVDWVIEFPFPDEYLEDYIKIIIAEFQKMAAKPYIKPSFNKTVENIAYYRRADYGLVEEAMSFMVSKGYLYRQEVIEGGEVKYVYYSANWELLRADGWISK